MKIFALLLTFFSTFLMAQTFRETVLYCDGIAIGSSKIINEKERIVNDYKLEKFAETQYTITEWIKKPNEKILPSIIKNNIDFPFFDVITCGIDNDYEEKKYELFYIKKIKGNWQILKTEILFDTEFEKFKYNVKTIENINKIKSDNERYSAYVDWILDDSNKDIHNLKNYYRDLDSTSVFMKYYNDKGIKGINNLQQQKLKNQIVKDIYDSESCGNYFEEELIYLVYENYKNEIDEAFLKRLKCYYESEKKRSEEEYVLSHIFEIKDTIITFHSYNKKNQLINDLVKKMDNFEIVNDEDILNKVEEILISEKILTKK